jgi:hypothetical protein
LCLPIKTLIKPAHNQPAHNQPALSEVEGQQTTNNKQQKKPGFFKKPGF